MNETGGNQRFQSLRRLALGLVVAPFLFGVVLYFIVGTAENGMDSPPAWMLLAQVAAALVFLVLSEMLGYRTIAAELGEEQDVANQSAMAYQSGMILRFALCEVVAIISLAMVFVADPQTFLIYPLGGLLSTALMLFEVWPSERTVAKTEASLERRGRPSYLRQALGL